MLGYRWYGERCRLWFQDQPGSCNDESLMKSLRELQKHLRAQRAIQIWDGLPVHESRKMKQYLAEFARWSEAEVLPGCSPDLNPIEELWDNIKGQELANRCVERLGEAEKAGSTGMEQLHRSKLPFSFMKRAGLFFYR